MAANRSMRKPRELAFHSLEERTMMAGDVAVSVVNGDLRIIGDGNANDVAVIQTMQNGALVNGSYFVTGRNGTTINGRATADGVHNTFTGVTRDFAIAMGGSDDHVTIGPDGPGADLYGPNNKIKVPRDIIANLGGGANTLLLNGLNVARNAFISSGNGADRLFVHASVQNDLTINSGAGTDLVDVYNSFARHNLNIDATGNNTNTSDVTVYLTTMNVGNDVNIATGGGQDSVYINQVGVNHDLSIQTGSNNDYVSISDSEAADLLFADLGSGNDTLTLSDTYGNQAILDGGYGFYDKLFETNVSFKSHTARNFEPYFLPRR